MKKHRLKRHSTKRPLRKKRIHRTTANSKSYQQYIVIISALVLLLGISTITLKTLQKTRVLGVSIEQTIPLTASESESYEGKSSPINSSENLTTGSLTNNSQVDCIGPDGKHFTATFKDCSDLNHNWKNNDFSFTPLNPQPTSTTMIHTNENKIEIKNDTQKEKTKIEINDQKIETELETPESKVELNTTGSKIELKVKKSDGTEVKLETENTLNKLNQILNVKDVEIGATADKKIKIKKGKVEAQTQLPLSINPTKQNLTITTSTGDKEVNVLPDQAVESILQTNLMNSIENEANETGIVQKIVLKELNSEPVFEIKGVSNKKVLGFIPVAFAKTAFVSAQTGQIIKTDQAFFNKILEAISL